MDLTDVIGDFGRVQWEVFLMSCYRSFVLVFEYYGVMFTISNPEHWCAPTETMIELNVTEWKECCLPKEENRYSQCQRFAVALNGTVDNSTLEKCDKYEYLQTSYTSIIQEWDLVCDRQWYIPHTYSIFHFGIFIGSPIAGYFSDRFGRRFSVVTGAFGLSFIHFVTYFSVSLQMFLVARAFSGCLYSFIMIPAITLFFEFCGPRQRYLVPIITIGFWAVCSVFAMEISSLLMSWKNYFLFTSTAIYLPFGIITYLFLPESVRWLIVKQKTTELEKELIRSAKKNGIQIIDEAKVLENISRKVLTDNENESGTGWRALIQDPRAAGTMAILLFLYFTITLCYVGFQISLQQFGNNFRVNFIILNICQLIGSVIDCLLQTTSKRRRQMIIIATLSAGVCFLLIPAISSDLLWLRSTVSMLGVFTLNFLYNNVIIFVNEVLPTNLRGLGSTLYPGITKIGPILSPHVVQLGKLHGEYIPYLIFGLLKITTTVFLFLLPDIQLRNLPDTVKESQRIMNLAEDDTPEEEILGENAT